MNSFYNSQKEKMHLALIKTNQIKKPLGATSKIFNCIMFFFSCNIMESFVNKSNIKKKFSFCYLFQKK